MRLKDLLASPGVAIARPEYVNAGQATNSGSGTTVSIGTVLMPAFIEAGNLLIAVFTNRTVNTTNGVDPVASATSLAGWTQLGVFSSITPSEFGLLDVWYKFATGSETALGTITYLASSSNVKIARVYQFRNVGGIAGGGYGAGKYQATNISPISLTTTKNKSMAVSFMMGITAGSLATYAGATGGTWTEPEPEYSTSTQNGSRLGMNIAPIDNPGTISGGSMAGAASNVSFSFVLEPKVTTGVPWPDTKLRVVQRTTAIGVADTSQNCTIVFPNTPAAGNLVILYFSYIATFQNYSFPAGFTDITDEVTSGNLRNACAYWVADGVTNSFTISTAVSGTVKVGAIGHEVKNWTAVPAGIGKAIQASTSAVFCPVNGSNITPVANSLCIAYMNNSNTSTPLKIADVTSVSLLEYTDFTFANRNRLMCSAEKYYASAGNELPYFFWTTGRSANAIIIRIL